MSSALIDIAKGVEGSKGKVTLSQDLINDLLVYVDQKQESISIERFRDGGCVINCEDLCNLVLGSPSTPNIPVVDETPEPETLRPQRKGRQSKKETEDANS